MLHILHILMTGYARIHGVRHLYSYYVHHHAIRFLMSGIPSETPATRTQAVTLLHWLVSNHISPADW